MNRRVLAMVLAGGKGTRLYPLTKDRAKPAVPFGGKYRIVDFVLSNLVNSGVYSTYVLTQFKSQSLLQHLRDTWQFGSLLPYQFIVPVPAQMRSPDEAWYQGTADAIFQNIDLINRAEPDLVLVFSADHVYRMNIREMIEFHNEKGADATVAAVPMAKELASEFGVIELGQDEPHRAFTKRRPMPPRFRAIRIRSSRRWAIMFLRPTSCCGNSMRTRPTRRAATTSAKTFCPA